MRRVDVDVGGYKNQHLRVVNVINLFGRISRFRQSKEWSKEIGLIPRQAQNNWATYYLGFLNSPLSVSFLFFVFTTVEIKYVHYKNLPKTGFKPWTSGIKATSLPTEPQPLPCKFKSLNWHTKIFAVSWLQMSKHSCRTTIQNRQYIWSNIISWLCLSKIAKQEQAQRGW